MVPEPELSGATASVADIETSPVDAAPSSALTVLPPVSKLAWNKGAVASLAGASVTRSLRTFFGGFLSSWKKSFLST